MKSSKKQLDARGYISAEELEPHINKTSEEVLYLLKSNIAVERTIGAMLSAGRDKDIFLPALVEMLQLEKKLYTKIALGESIESYGVDAVRYLIPLLGKIGANHLKKPALIDLNKKSYPLPRDISGRIIIRIGEPALPFLEDLFFSGDYSQITEAIDVMGHIAFYSGDFRSEDILHEFLNYNSDDELIPWKIIRAFQSFGSDKTVNFLKFIIEKNSNIILRSEAERSLKQIEKRRCNV
jgi:hypothetical protein